MRSLHNELTVALTHDHTMYGLAARRKQGETAVFSNHYAPLFRQGGVNVVGWVMGGDPPFFGIENDNPWWGSMELLDMVWREAEESKDDLAICTNAQDIEDAVAADKIALILTMEGAFPLEEGPDPLISLRMLHRLGSAESSIRWAGLESADRCQRRTSSSNARADGNREIGCPGNESAGNGHRPGPSA